MTALNELPRNVVAPIAARNVAAVLAQAEQLGQLCLHTDCAQAPDARGVLERLGCGLGLPEYYGANLDALYDCLTDFEPRSDVADPGIVLLVENLPRADQWQGRQRADLLALFRDVAEDFEARGIAFRVLYSVRD